MKKFFFTLFFFAAIFNISSIQAQGFEKGNTDVAARIGLGSAIFGADVMLEYGLGQYIGFGAGFNIGSYKYTDSNNKDQRATFASLGLRASYHWGKHISSLSDEWDFYAGLNTNFSNEDIGFILFNLHVGANYFFRDNLAVNFEVGSGISYARIGILGRF